MNLVLSFNQFIPCECRCFLHRTIPLLASENTTLIILIGESISVEISFGFCRAVSGKFAEVESRENEVESHLTNERCYLIHFSPCDVKKFLFKGTVQE